jgi:hypothetical protein
VEPQLAQSHSLPIGLLRVSRDCRLNRPLGGSIPARAAKISVVGFASGAWNRVGSEGRRHVSSEADLVEGHHPRRQRVCHSFFRFFLGGGSKFLVRYEVLVKESKC